MKKAELAFIVDDDTMYTSILAKMIKVKKACNNLMIFGNGAEALEYLQFAIEEAKNVPDVILLDINMPIMDGFDFLEAYISLVPQLPKDITIYMITSSVHDADREKAETFNQISKFIVKPITMEEIERLFDITD